MKDKKRVAGSVIKTQTKVLAYVVICLVITIMGSSYALFFQVKHNTTNQVIQAGNLSITYSNQGTQINSTANAACFEPMDDATAKTTTNCTYTLSVKNAGDLPSTFKLNLKKGTGNAVALSKFKAIVKRGTTGATYTEVTGSPKQLTDTDINTIYSESIPAGTTINYSVQVYPVDGQIDEDTDDGKTLALEIQGVGEVDVSKANLK